MKLNKKNKKIGGKLNNTHIALIAMGAIGFLVVAFYFMFINELKKPDQPKT